MSEDAEGWVPLGRPSWWMPVMLASPLLIVVLTVNVTDFALSFLRSLPHVWLILIMVVTNVAVYALTLAAIWLFYPRAYLNPATGSVRAGRRTARYADITSARLLVSASKRRRALHLVLRAEGRLSASVLVRDAHSGTLDQTKAALVREMIRASNIAMPASPDDPKGRFAKYNFPDNVTRDEALELVEHPPAFGDPLPIPPRA